MSHHKMSLLLSSTFASLRNGTDQCHAELDRLKLFISASLTETAETPDSNQYTLRPPLLLPDRQTDRQACNETVQLMATAWFHARLSGLTRALERGLTASGACQVPTVYKRSNSWQRPDTRCSRRHIFWHRVKFGTSCFVFFLLLLYESNHMNQMNKPLHASTHTLKAATTKSFNY